MKEFRNVIFKKEDGYTLRMDIYVPETTEKPSLIMWIHGGAWL